MSANLLAKVTGGLCDDLLTNVIRAWDIGSSEPKTATIIVAPAMNDRVYSSLDGETNSDTRGMGVF